MDDYKYLVLFPVEGSDREKIETLQYKAAEYTGLQPPYEKLPPHVSFSRPFQHIEEETVLNLTRSMALQTRASRITVSHLFPFGRHYIVLPVHATRRVAAFWVGLNNLLSVLPEYEHGPYDHDNTLHITIAEKTSEVFDTAWPQIQKLNVETMHIPVWSVEVHRKPVTGGMWEKIKTFDLPS